MEGYFKVNVHLGDIRGNEDIDTLFFSYESPWWTHDRTLLKEKDGELYSPFGEKIQEVDKLQALYHFGKDGRKVCGPHGVITFLAANHVNMQKSKEDSTPIRLKDWPAYHEVVDRQAAAKLEELQQADEDITGKPWKKRPPGKYSTHYAIFHKPKENPEGYLVRRFFIIDGGVYPEMYHKKADTLEKARTEVPDGHVGIPRSDEDDETLLETWI